MKVAQLLFLCIGISSLLVLGCSAEELPVEEAVKPSAEPVEPNEETESGEDQHEEPTEEAAQGGNPGDEDTPPPLKTDRELVNQLVSGFSAATAERKPISFENIQPSPNAELLQENPQFAQLTGGSAISAGELGTAVVAQENVRLYADPGHAMDDEGIKNVEVLATVPTGAIIPLHGKYGEDWAIYALGEYNQWWITEYDGHQGVVFGAFLDGEGAGVHASHSVSKTGPSETSSCTSSGAQPSSGLARRHCW